MSPSAGFEHVHATPALAGSVDDPAHERAALAVQAGIDRERNFRLLFERFHRPIERFFDRRGVPPEDCLDLTQETFLGIDRGLKACRSEDRLSHWVFRIAATTFLPWLRAGKAARRAGLTTTPEAAEGEAAAFRLLSRQLDHLIDRETSLALRRAVEELPDQMRHCLVLRPGQDLSNREIATLMQLSQETVKAYLFQARRSLKERLGKAADFAFAGDSE